MRITETQLRELIHESIREVILEMSLRRMKELQEFIRQARAIHGNKYDYSNVNYMGTREYVLFVPNMESFLKDRIIIYKGKDIQDV